MKKFFSLIALFSCAAVSYAQSSMLATLNHEGTVSTFYGATALRDAHNAAVHGDVITLSSGSFVSTDITKAITLRGAGMEVDTLSGTEPTVISGDFNIQIADTVSQRLIIEGIYHNHNLRYRGTLTNAMFLKNRLYNVSYADKGVMKNACFIHCRIADGLDLYTSSSASCINCAIEDPCSTSETDSNFEFLNCVIKISDRLLGQIKTSIYKNCLICNRSDIVGYESYRIPSSCMAYNCIGFNSDPYFPLFSSIPNSTNVRVNDFTTVFKTYTGQSLQKLDSENFELTDEAKSKYLGTDGTQVGIYGGSLPFTSTPSNPQITKCNVAAKSTADGKLSVDIEVKAAE